MDKIGTIKEVDKLGRIVIPKDLRKRYGITTEVEIITTKEGLILRSPDYVLIKKEKALDLT